MKKRSLVSAVAMLIVSAIVLTSATYAWFASNTSATVENVSATVGNAAGSIYISGDNGTTWRSGLQKGDITNGTVVDALTPVSYDQYTDHFTGGQFTANSLEFTATKTANTAFYSAFTISVYTETPGTVTVTPTLGSNANVPYVYASIKAGSTQKILGTADDGYTPILVTGETTGTATDNNTQNGIIDADEATAGTDIALSQHAVSVTDGSKAITLEMAGKSGNNLNAQDVTFYVWAEGQDSNCVGTSSGAPRLDIAFNFTPAVSSTNNSNNG